MVPKYLMGKAFFPAFSTKAIAESRDMDHFIYDSHTVRQKQRSALIVQMLQVSSESSPKQQASC